MKWQTGKALIFDDCYEHSVWNKTNEERVILLFDIWSEFFPNTLSFTYFTFYCKHFIKHYPLSFFTLGIQICTKMRLYLFKVCLISLESRVGPASRAESSRCTLLT